MMKKRLLSLLLIVTMLVALFPVGVSAATQTVDGVSYTTVSNSSELYSALSAGGKILLTNDIVLSSSFSGTVTIKPGTVLDGNGYSLTYSSNRTAPLFKLAAGKTIGQAPTYIRNIGFGTRTAYITLTGSQALFSEESKDTSYAIFQNVNFFLKGSDLAGNTGGVFGTLTGVVSFYGCNLTADLHHTGGSGLFGGWIGENSGDLIMTNCTTAGTIVGSGSFTGGFMGQAGASNTNYTNCTNLANVTGPTGVAGFTGNIGTGAISMYFTGCVNSGNITSTGSGYNSMAGGLLGRATNKRDQGDQRLRVIYNCINYGTITSGCRAGGFVGSTHDYDTSGQDANYCYHTFENCVNFGAVNGGQYAGGMMGIASPITYRAEITNCINVGKITSSDGYAGNFAGMLCNGVISGGYAAGVLSTALGSDVLVPSRSGNYTLQAGDFQGQSWAISAPTVTSVRYIGPKTSVSAGIVKIANANLSSALRAMSLLCGVSFVAADPDDTTAYVVSAEPILRGVQQSVAVTNGNTALRFVASINAVEAYQSIGFTMVIHTNGKTVEISPTTTSVYTALNAVSSNGSISQVTAESLSSKYLCAITLTGIPVSDDVLIELTPFSVDQNGTKHVGKTRVVTCNKGVYQTESVVLNDTLLKDYAIVYANSDTMNEKLLATRMSDEIAKVTGISLPVLSDTQSCSRSAKLLIGKTRSTATTATTRTIRTQSNAHEIVISGKNSSQLSESIEYFIETIDKNISKGDFSWSFSGSVPVPIDAEVSMMAYNMGAKDNARIKKAEWDLILDYLPDIWTSQEPWAGFLDDFLNDYAVKPTTKFQASASDDDVMQSNVNNKAFTGNGYYGVYWGLPRWVPGDANNSGKASYSVILYAKDRFTPDLTRSGTFWLSNSVNTSGSVYSGSNFARCATYLTLTDKNTGKTFTVVNVHLDFVASVQIAQVNILLREMKARVGADMPIFITGDMNSEASSTPIALYKENDYMDMTAMDEIADRSYRVYRNIDWFFTNHPEQINVSYYKNCNEHTFLNNLWNGSMVMGMPSDHPAIYTEFSFK